MSRPATRTGKDVAPAGLAAGMRITFAPLTVQRLPSGPVTIGRASLMSLTSYLTAASGSLGEKLATPPLCVTQRLPSGPVVIPIGLVMFAGSYSVTLPFGVIRAMSLV